MNEQEFLGLDEEESDFTASESEDDTSEISFGDPDDPYASDAPGVEFSENESDNEFDFSTISSLTINDTLDSANSDSANSDSKSQIQSNSKIEPQLPSESDHLGSGLEAPIDVQLSKESTESDQRYQLRCRITQTLEQRKKELFSEPVDQSTIIILGNMVVSKMEGIELPPDQDLHITQLISRLKPN